MNLSSNHIDLIEKLTSQNRHICRWQSPSNIAIVKYWGKKGEQIPANPSISFTLNHCYTDTSVAISVRKKKKRNLTFLFHGEERKSFCEKIEKFLLKLERQLPWLVDVDLHIDSKNSFPHSAGIASSASSMSALSLCLFDFEDKLNERSETLEFFKKTSFASRLGSGSACRSLYSECSIWGKLDDGIGDDHYAFRVECVHENFKKTQNAILIVSDAEKAVSSTAGHALMDNHPYGEKRFKIAKQRCAELLHILKDGDWKRFGKILEIEALELHSLMMMSDPSFILLKPLDLELISLIRNKRRETGLNLYFTLDAGPNIHLLYPYKERFEVREFIDREIVELLPTKTVIFDEMGQGPRRL